MSTDETDRLETTLTWRGEGCILVSVGGRAATAKKDPSLYKSGTGS